MYFKMASAICFNLDQFKMSSGNGLIHDKIIIKTVFGLSLTHKIVSFQQEQNNASGGLARCLRHAENLLRAESIDAGQLAQTRY